MSLLDRHAALADAHAALRAQGVDPFNLRFDALISPTEGRLDGRMTLLFGTNNYLGLTFDPDCIAAATEATRAWGTGSTGSRIANGSYAGHLDLEEAFARFYGRQHALTFSTGYQANLAMLSGLVGRGDYLLLDADSHASLYDGARASGAEVIRFRHNDPVDLRRRLARLKDAPGNRLIVAEGLYSMMGDVAPLAAFAEVKREFGAYLLVDEAHSLGVMGATGRGAAEAAGIDADADFIVGTFSKSLGAVGGFCVSDHPRFELMRIVSRPYMFSASLPPAIVASTLCALGKIEHEPELRTALGANSRRLFHGLRDKGFETGPEVGPVTAVLMPDLFTAAAFWRELLLAGVYVNLALPPATPTTQPLLRLSVSARHSFAQIDEAVAAFDRIRGELGLWDDAARPLAKAAS